jgi:glutaryl-CoA dehydrogenase (non-decarboxylating)
MRLDLSDLQKKARLSFRRFVEDRIAPYAAGWDQEERLPMEIIDELRKSGYLGAPVAEKLGGAMDPISYGLLTEEIARGCSSVRSLMTVHDMVALAVWRWGNHNLKAEFGDAVAKGDMLCAIAVSEPDAGSDASSVTTVARVQNDEYILNGQKKWISFGQIATVFLVLARCEGKLSAFVVPSNCPDLIRRPIRGLIGTRASLLAELEFNDCRIPSHYLVGKVGFGLSHVIATALDHGRYSVAWGSVGIAQACLDACLEYTAKRKQFGIELCEHPILQRKLTEMITNTRAARLLCYRAGYLREVGEPAATAETMVAKYFASKVAVRTANDAVQLHGANGLTDRYPVARYLRDAKVMEIIEGSTQIQQMAIANLPLSEL